MRSRFDRAKYQLLPFLIQITYQHAVYLVKNKLMFNTIIISFLISQKQLNIIFIKQITFIVLFCEWPRNKSEVQIFHYICFFAKKIRLLSYFYDIFVCMSSFRSILDSKFCPNLNTIFSKKWNPFELNPRYFWRGTSIRFRSYAMHRSAKIFIRAKDLTNEIHLEDFLLDVMYIKCACPLLSRV